MQGWTPDFIPKLTADAVARKLIDQVVPVNGNRALEMARKFARQEGIFCGTSGGATFAGAIAIAEQAPPNTTILCMLPDTGERYLSTPLFEGIPEQMTEEEMQFSRSTPGYRFDLPAAAAATSPPAESAPVSASAEDFVARIGDPDNGRVVRARVVRVLLGGAQAVRRMGVCRAIDLDSVEYQQDDWGGQIRAVLRARLGSNTIPQIFVSGEHIGGATDTFEAYRSGELQRLLDQAGVAHGDLGDKNPFELLPGWLHKR
jgi:cysteine synthase A